MSAPSSIRFTDEIVGKPGEEVADNNAHYVAPSELNTWIHTGGKGEAQL